MQQTSVPLVLDKLGGLSRIKNINKLNLTEKEELRLSNYLKNKIVKQSHLPKIVSMIYIIGFLIMIIFVVNMVIITSHSNEVVLGFLVACPLALIILGAVGGNCETKYNKLTTKMWKDVVKITNNKFSIEKGYVPRFGKGFKGNKNYCTYQLRYLVLFDLKNTEFKVVQGEMYENPDMDVKCIITPYHRTNAQRLVYKDHLKPSHHIKKKPKPQSPKLPKEKGKGNHTEFEEAHKQDPSDSPIIISTRTIDMSNDSGSDSEVAKQSQRTPELFKTDYKKTLNESNDYIFDKAEENSLKSPEDPRRYSEGTINGEDFWADEQPGKFKY